MKKIILFILIAASGCQTPANKNAGKTAESKPVHESSLIELGGEKQYVEITGASDQNPVLLFLHGGPGWPQTPHLRYFNSDLTKSVTLVSWDQAGCGKSYMNNPEPKNLSADRFVNDAHELTQLLKKKFNKDRIFLAGFSWGSIIGLKLVEKYPEDYAAYFGISQVIDIQQSIKLSRDWIAEQARLKGDTNMLKRVSQLENGDTSFCKSTLECFLQKYGMLTEYGGAIYKKGMAAEIEKAEKNYEDYRNYDWFKAFMYSANAIGDDLFTTNLSGISQLKIPAYFFMGRNDNSLPTIETEGNVQKLKDPAKEIVWFEESGHEPLEEEAAAFNKAIAERILKK